MKICSLGVLKKGERGIIVNYHDCGNGQSRMLLRLIEMGLLQGSEVEVKHEAPPSQDPIAVSVRGALIALRRSEANFIRVARVE